MTDYREKDSTVVVSDGGDRGTGLGMIVGILLVIALLIAVWYFTLGPGRGTTTNSGGAQPVPSVQAPASAAPAGSTQASPAAS
jgi:hypothetical protein